MSQITLSETFYLQNCCSCGIPFAVPQNFDLERRKDAKSFYCPNGHSQSYSTSEADKLRAQLQQKQQEVDRARRDVEQQKLWRAEAEARETKERRAKHRLQKRISAGVCPCCNRTFEDLARHMSTKHKGYALPPAKGQKLIEGRVQ